MLDMMSLNHRCFNNQSVKFWEGVTIGTIGTKGGW